MENVEFIYKSINRKMKQSSLYELLNAIAILENLDWNRAFQLYVRTLHQYAYGPSEDEMNVRCIMKESGYTPQFDFRFNKYALLKNGEHFYAVKKEGNALQMFGIVNPDYLDDSYEYVLFVKDFQNYAEVNRKKHFQKDVANIEYMNVNPKGNLVGDCSIRSLALAMHTDWHNALDILAKQGLEGHELHFNKVEVVEKVLRNYGFEKHPHLPVLLTCKQFCEKMDAFKTEGDILLYAGDFHITTVVKLNDHYKIIDSWDCSGQIAGDYFIKKKEEVVEISYVDRVVIHPTFREGIVYQQKNNQLYVAFEDEDRILNLDWVKEHCTFIDE